ncbi:MAG: hypothetical protein QOH49_525 [Acidobacteriota bacterium]|nr:hypothetical protein [Acidobacteriota bacterium]
MRVVVASPSDVKAERDTLPNVINELNRSIAGERNLTLDLIRWEQDAYPGLNENGPQGLLDPILRIPESDILIGIFWKRFGTPTAQAGSGTEHEISMAYEAWRKHGRPQVMLYFNQKGYTPKTEEEARQWAEVLAFKQRFPGEGLWWEYKGRASFEKFAREHLTNYILHLYPLQQQPQESVQPVVGNPEEEEGRGEVTAAVKPRFWKRGRWRIAAAAVVLAAVTFIGYQVYLSYRPAERRNPWSAIFNKSEKLNEHWDYPKDSWTTVPGEGTVIDPDTQEMINSGQKVDVTVNKDDEALLVKGREMGVPGDLGGKVFYDFKADFKVRFKSGSVKGAWVLRAQRDRQSGYLFELTQEGESLFLSGWIYERGQKGENLGREKLPFSLLRETQSISVDVTAKGNQFLYKLTYEDIESDDNRAEGSPLDYSFKDDPKNVRWTWGTFGLLIPDDTSVMLIEYLYIYPLPRAT